MSGYRLPFKINRDLTRVEKAMGEVVSSVSGPLHEPCLQTLAAGGKRLRPALVLVCGLAGSYRFESLLPHAIAVEFVHMASLVHDDVLDDARTRRGVASVQSKWGKRIATATGDFLFSKAFEILSRSGSPEACAVLAETSLQLTRGELLQRQGSRHLDVKLEEYLERIKAKTASLFRASCLLGAKASGAAGGDVEALSRYGEHLGIAFQIFDDVLDVSGDSDTLGKEIGADFRDGTLTLPMMLAVEQLGDDAWLRRAMAEDAAQGEHVRNALKTMAATSAAADSREVARSQVRLAVEAAEELESRSLRAILADIGNYVIERYY